MQRDLSAYFPIPPHRRIEEHFCDPKLLWPSWLNRLRKRMPVSFYQKRRNAEIARHLTTADMHGTDLGTIINEVKQRAEEARQF